MYLIFVPDLRPEQHYLSTRDSSYLPPCSLAATFSMQNRPNVLTTQELPNLGPLLHSIVRDFGCCASWWVLSLPTAYRTI